MDCSSRHFQHCWCLDVEEGRCGARLKLAHRQDINVDITTGHKESRDTGRMIILDDQARQQMTLHFQLSLCIEVTIESKESLVGVLDRPK